MKRSLLMILMSGLLPLAAAQGPTTTQHPLAGTWVEGTIGMVVAFDTAANGQLQGTLHGSGAPLPLTIQADQQTASGWFMLEGQITGFSAQLQADSTLFIWFYGLDANGQPIPGTEEQYSATRQQVNLPGVTQPPSANMPPLVSQPPAFNQPPAEPAGVTPNWPGQGPATGQQLVGTWQTITQVQGVPLTIVLTVNADGTYREEGYVDGVQSAWYTGHWTMTPDNLLHQTATQYSPEFCVRGQCTPNIVTGTDTSSVQFSGPDTVILTLQPEAGQQPLQIMLQRTGPGQQPGLPPGGGWYPGTMPTYGMPAYQYPITPLYTGGTTWEPAPSTWDVNADPTGTEDFIRDVIWGE